MRGIGCMDMKLTEKQQQILDFISAKIEEQGYPPSVREICSAVGLKSTSTVHGYLDRLQKKGFIQKDASKTRAIRIMNDSRVKKFSSIKPSPVKEMIEVPIIGRVTAGQPILAVENIEDTFPLPMEFAKNKDLFMLRVNGDSMVNAGILDNDFVIVEQTNTAKNGDIVVALIEDEATVKRFFKEKGHFRLQPENDYMEPIIVKELSILGKVVGVFRKL